MSPCSLPGPSPTLPARVSPEALAPGECSQRSADPTRRFCRQKKHKKGAGETGLGHFLPFQSWCFSNVVDTMPLPFFFFSLVFSLSLSLFCLLSLCFPLAFFPSLSLSLSLSLFFPSLSFFSFSLSHPISLFPSLSLSSLFLPSRGVRPHPSQTTWRLGHGKLREPHTHTHTQRERVCVCVCVCVCVRSQSKRRVCNYLCERGRNVPSRKGVGMLRARRGASVPGVVQRVLFRWPPPQRPRKFLVLQCPLKDFVPCGVGRERRTSTMFRESNDHALSPRKGDMRP